jgi:carbon monoxide dehydrogenase subunit G
MKLEGTQKFTVPSAQVFDAILNPEVLKASIPGASAVSYSSPAQLQVEITLPFPGLHGPFTVFINIANKQAPNHVEFNVPHSGKGGTVDATCKISLADEANGSVLTYNANAKLEGLIAVADNPLGQGVVKGKLAEFFKNLEKAVTQVRA